MLGHRHPWRLVLFGAWPDIGHGLGHLGLDRALWGRFIVFVPIRTLSDLITVFVSGGLGGNGEAIPSLSITRVAFWTFGFVLPPAEIFHPPAYLPDLDLHFLRRRDPQWWGARI